MSLVNEQDLAIINQAANMQGVMNTQRAAIARALARGADIVVTGRCVDSAVTLGAAIHNFGWGPQDLDALAGGSLAGHILECGPQATGGNFTDWRAVAQDLAAFGRHV